VKHLEPRLRAYRDLLASEPVSVTSLRDPARLWDVHVDDALTALPIVQDLGPRTVVDVGSGGGSPGIPIALATGIEVTLLEATAAKCGFLHRAVAALDLACPIVHDRSEHFGRGDGREAFDLATARALARPPVAAELCLPLVRTGGHVLIWAADTDVDALERTAEEVGGRLVETITARPNRHLILIAKASSTPDAFPRRAGMASKRPLVRVRSRT
jgi:16S rRNA (guanine527-N7)-methyltransferase